MQERQNAPHSEGDDYILVTEWEEHSLMKTISMKRKVTWVLRKAGR